MADPSDDIDDVDTGDIDAATMPTAQYPVSPLAYGQRWTRDPTMMKGALDLMARSYKTSTDAIRDAKAALMAKRTGNGEAWLAFGAGLLKPTRTGSFGESLGQAGEAMLGPLQRARAEELQRQNMLTGYDLKSATLDRQMAADMLRASRTPVGASGPLLLPVGGSDTGGGTGGGAPSAGTDTPWEIPAEYESKVLEASKRTGVPPQAIAGLIFNESRWNPNAVAKGDQRGSVNPKTGQPYDSIGLGQWGEQYAQQRGFNPRDPNASIDAVADRLKELASSYGGNYAMARLAYGWGEGNVANWLKGGANPNVIDNGMKIWLARSLTGAKSPDQALRDWPRIAKMLRPGPVDVGYPEYVARGAAPSPGDVGMLPTQAGGEAHPQAGKPPPQGSTIADANDIMPGLKLPEGARGIYINPKTMLPYTDRNGNIATVNRNGGITYVQAPKKGSGQDRIKVFDPEANQYVWYRQSTGEKMLDRNGNIMLAGPAPADTTVPGGSMQAMMPNGKVGIWVPRANSGKGDWQRDAQGNPLEAPRDPNAANMAARQRRAHAQTAAILAAEQKDNRYGPNEAAARYQQLFDHFMSQEDTTGQDRPGPVPPASGGAGPATPAAPPATGGTIPRAPTAPAPTTGGAIPPPAIAPTPKPSIDEQAEARANAPINAKYIDDARRAADTAGTQLAQINVVRSLNDKDITGAMAPMQEFMGRWAEALGLETIGGKKVRDFIRSASDQKSFFALSNAFLLAVQEAQKGVSTEGDAARISDSWAKLSNTKETNRFLLNYYENMAWWQKNRANFLNGVISRGGTNKAAIKEWEEFKRKTPLTAMTGENKDQLMFLPEYIKRAQAALPNMDKNEVAAAAIKKWQREYGG